MVDYLSASIWFHSIVIGSLIPNWLGRVVANRAIDPTTGRFVSDWEEFILFIAGVFIGIVVIQPIIDYMITSYFVKLVQANSMISLANVCVLVAESYLYKKLILGR